MPKYAVYAIYTASKKIGEYEADDEDQALEMSEADEEGVMLCHQCAGEIDLNTDPWKFEANEIEPGDKDE
ncbi:MAG: hypothetical protein GY761_12440 [Hyphomicrobiales bacterium]|nr:hypothetical protein [Hyphomicrobiales bacterium]